MKISVITITNRKNPRFAAMAKTLAANLKPYPDVELEWVVVDTLQKEREGSIEAGFPVVHVEQTGEFFPNHNGARNTGVLAASGDYLFFLDDCTVVTRSWMQGMKALAKEGHGMRCNMFFQNDIEIPDDGLIANHEGGAHNFVDCLATTVAGGAFGVPREKILEVGGFDEIYSGIACKNEDLDAFVRLERAGLKWRTSENCCAIQLMTSHDKAPYDTPKLALEGRKLFNALIKDRERTQALRGISAHETGTSGSGSSEHSEPEGGALPSVLSSEAGGEQSELGGSDSSPDPVADAPSDRNSHSGDSSPVDDLEDGDDGDDDLDDLEDELMS